MAILVPSFHVWEKLAGSVAANEVVKIKFEVDITPPKGAEYEHKYRLLPVPYSVKMLYAFTFFR